MIGLVAIAPALLGLGWPLVARWRTEPAHRLVAALCLSFIATYFLGWLIYTLHLPNEMAFGVVPLALLGLLSRRSELLNTLSDSLVRRLLMAQGLLLVWNLCWLGLVLSYSGGGWTGDWFGHWQRCQFFLKRPDVHILFNGFDPLPSRPPLVNVVVADWLAIAGNEFANYQIAMTAWSSLAFLPAALLAIRAARAVPGGSPGQAIAILTVLFLTSPMAVQNATFAWTKLPAAVFTLAAAEFFLAARPWDGVSIRRAPGILCGTCVAAALLAHYSAAPYAIVLAGAWLAGGLRSGPRRQWLVVTAASALSGLLLLATWFGWALAVYGPAGTFLSNTTATDRAPTVGLHVARIAANIFDTVVPHFLRPLDRSLIQQSSPWGFARDWWFECYQLNLLMVFGSLGWLVVMAAVMKHVRLMPVGHRRAWLVSVSLIVLLGLASVSSRDTWGVAHISMHPLTLAGLACVAGSWSAIAPSIRWLSVVGAVMDLGFGIVLHYAVQGFLIDRWLTPERPLAQIVHTYNSTTAGNFLIKEAAEWRFVGDAFSRLQLIPVSVAFVTLALAIWNIRRQPGGIDHPSTATPS